MRVFSRFAVVALLLCSALVSGASAATYYVATTGDNSRSCVTAQTITTPKLTIANARACLTAGDILNIRAGTYNESIQDGFGTGTNFGAGAITIRKYPGDAAVVWKTTGTSASAVPAQFALYLASTASQYLIFDTITFDGNAKIGGTVAVTGNWGPSGAHHIRFTSCNFQYSGGEISISHTSGNEFIGGSMHDNDDSSGLRHGIYISSEASDNLVDSMNVYNNLGYGIHVWTGTTAGSNGNIFRNNRVYNNGTATGQCGILYSGGNDGQIYNNVVYNNGGGGICVAHAGTALRTLVYNNTVVSNLGQGGFYGIYNLSSTTILRNNIIYQNGTGNKNSWPSGTVESNNCVGINPIFVNAGARDYRLQVGSPAIDTGYNLTATIPTDYDGITNSVPMEIGAHNYGTVLSPLLLVFTTPPVTTLEDTIIPSVIVCARDTAGVPQTSFAANISLALGTNPGPSTLTGGAGGAPTSGCRTFPGLSLDVIGTGYTLVASATGATDGTSGPFNIIVTPTGASAPLLLRLNRVPTP